MKRCKYCNSSDVTQFSPYKFYDLFKCNSCKLWFWKSIEECCRNPQNRIVVQHIDHNFIQIRVQCDNCGGCLNMKKPLSHPKFKTQIKGLFSLEKHENWKQEKTSENEYIFATSKAIKLQNSNYAKYLNHLQSPFWKTIRKRALERDNNTCQKCFVATAQEVHHLTYINLGNENLEELISYCKPCHKKMHEILI